MEQSTTKVHKKDDNLLVTTRIKRSDGAKSRHRQQVKDKVKSDKTELVQTSSDVKNGADDKVTDKVVKSDKTKLVTTNSDVNDGAGDKVQW